MAHSSMPSGLPTEAHALVISSMVTPGCFWAHEVRGGNMTESGLKLCKLEEKLTEHFKDDNLDFTPKSGEVCSVIKGWVYPKILYFLKIGPKN